MTSDNGSCEMVFHSFNLFTFI